MELMQLEMFVAMVEEGSVHGAAKRVCRTAPAVSMALRKMEAEMETPLFDRSHRYAYRLTPAGEVLLGYAKKMLTMRDEMNSAIQGLNDLQSGRLRIGAIESINVNLLPRLAQEFHREYPEVKIEVLCKHSDELVSELRDWELDLALLSHLPEENGWEAQLMMRDEVVLIVSPKHPLAQHNVIRLEELSAESIIMEGTSSSLYRKLTEALNRSRAPLHIHIESAAIETIKKMVAMNVGVGFVPLLCVHEELESGELTRVRVKGLSLERTLWAVRRASSSETPALRAFMQMIRKCASEWQKDPGHPRTGGKEHAQSPDQTVLKEGRAKDARITLLPLRRALP